MNSLEKFKKIMEKSKTKKVEILTNHYKILGQVFECDECNKEIYINLINASICLINDSFENDCCEYSNLTYDWLHVNYDKIVAFSFIKE